jgi:hypothetical protein
MVYIFGADTCSPIYWYQQVSRHRAELTARPPRVVLPVALLRSPGVPPPRPAVALISLCQGKCVSLNRLTAQEVFS